MSKKSRAARDGRSGFSREELVGHEIRRLRAEIGIEMARKTNASGTNVFNGDIDEEYNPELKTIRGRVGIYDRMINDPFVRGQIRNIEMTLTSGVRWNMVDGTQEQQDLVGGNILRQGPPKFWCNQSWYDFLHEALGCLIYGWSMFGLTRGIVDNKMVYSNRKWLHPRSVDEDGWRMDEEDNLYEVWRSFTDAKGKSVTRQAISVQDLYLMCWDRRGPNWEGTALIRPMFKNWKVGDIAEKIDIIDLQNRGIAIPVAKLSGAGGPKERDTLVEILRTLRGGNKDKAFLVLEKDESLEFLTTQGSAKDASRIIDAQHVGISKVGGGEYAEISGMAGGRASTSVLATGFFINTDAIRIILQDKINFGEGPMPGLCESLQTPNFDINARGFKYSYVSGSRVSPTEQFDNIPLIQDSVKSGLVPPTLSLCNETLRRLGWPILTEQEFNEGMARQAGPAPVGRPSEAGADPNPSRGDALSNAAPEPQRSAPSEPSPAPKAEVEPADPVARRSLQQSSFGREPTDEENHVLALAQIDAENRSAEQKYAARIFDWQRREIEQIVEGIRSGRVKPAMLLKKDAEATLLRYTNQLSNDLRNILTQVRNFGGGQVRAEMRRQATRKAIAAYNDCHDDQGQFCGDGGGGGGFGSAGSTVDGREVLGSAPNQDSIGSSLTDYKVLPGVREVPMAAFDPAYEPRPYSVQEQERLDRLTAEIRESKKISPLIVVVDKEGPYILEGGHRFDALYKLGAKSFPAMVVVDTESAGEDPKEWKWKYRGSKKLYAESAADVAKALFNDCHDDRGQFCGDGGGGGGTGGDGNPDISHDIGHGVATTKSRIDRAVSPTPSTPSDPGYVYHATNQERAQEIADSGAVEGHVPDFGTDQETWPDGSMEKRSYWNAHANVVSSFAPEYGKAVILRAPDHFVPGREQHTGDRYAKAPVPAQSLEILTDRGWEPLVQKKSAPKG